MAMTREEALTIVASIVREHSRECREPKPCQDCELEAEAIAALSAQADTKQAEPLSSWMPIETAPQDGTRVLLWCPNRFGGFMEKGSFRRDANASPSEGPLWLDDIYDDYSTGYASTPLSPTHWQPLPAPPTLHQLGAKVEVSDG